MTPEAQEPKRYSEDHISLTMAWLETRHFEGRDNESAMIREAAAIIRQLRAEAAELRHAVIQAHEDADKARQSARALATRAAWWAFMFGFVADTAQEASVSIDHAERELALPEDQYAMPGNADGFVDQFCAAAVERAEKEQK